MSRVHFIVVACALALGLGCLLVTAAPAFADDPPTGATPVASSTPTTPPSQPTGNPAPDRSGGLLGFLPDPKQWAAEVFNQVLVGLFQGISSAVRSVVNGVLGSSLNFVTQTPPAGSYASPTVQALWNVVRMAANGALVLIVLWGGLNLIVREHIGSPYHEAMELFPRLVIGALLVNTSLSWAQFAIDANNALCQAVAQASLPAWERAGSASQLLADVVAGLIYLVTSLLLLLQMLMRLALIDVLLVVSPLG
ncbi:MAG: hypothetical protein NTZ05_13335, partial [Chloroflexi bacterium]|nr:hypothetical protein [Chloroflexota bacterium]